jgi:predicted nucleic acid-binding protein
MLKTYSFTGIGGRDATILSFMKQKGIRDIATHDEDFTRVEVVNVIDPVIS